MELEIQAQHTELHPRWREMIDRRVSKISEFCSEIVRLHVTLVHSAHHLRGDEEVRLLASVPHETLKVHKAMADMGDAIHAAFTALEHELHGFIDRRRDSHRRVKGNQKS
ncbi:MAG TPA: HPF/RaiA family ribosome-associated protein [Candidatus Acidoferrales bacterium]|nr:HPF/RaiA family ribosome-associated protein [Candidatus Acidoferrales bacterium]